MIVARLKLRSLCICLLAAASFVSLHASVPVYRPAAQRALHSEDAANRVLATAGSPSHAPSRTCLGAALTNPSNSFAPPSARRIFVEDTTAPSTGALRTARLHVAMMSFAPPRPASPALRNASTSASNRQRAP